MKRKAFTLIELLISFGLVAMVFAVGSKVLYTSLTSSRKAAAVMKAKGEGSYVIRSMSDTIRFADKVKCDTATNMRLQIDRFGKPSVLYRFITTSNPDKISSNSGTLTNTGTLVADLTTKDVNVSVPATECGGKMFECLDNDKTVTICFMIDKAGGIDLTDRAMGTKGIVFQTQIVVNNLAN